VQQRTEVSFKRLSRSLDLLEMKKIPEFLTPCGLLYIGKVGYVNGCESIYHSIGEPCLLDLAGIPDMGLQTPGMELRTFLDVGSIVHLDFDMRGHPLVIRHPYGFGLDTTIQCGHHLLGGGLGGHG
jgi:hypothetical protein